MGLDMNMLGIYGLYNRVTGKWYVGQSIHIEERLKQHRRASAKGQYLHKSIKKYGWDAFDVHILATVEDANQLDELERHYISKYNCLYPNGYNFDGGGIRGSRVISDATRQRLRDAQKGKDHSHLDQYRHLGGLSQVKTFRLTRTDGSYIDVTNLSKWCKDNNYIIANFHAVRKGKRRIAYGFVSCVPIS